MRPGKGLAARVLVITICTLQLMTVAHPVLANLPTDSTEVEQSRQDARPGGDEAGLVVEADALNTDNQEHSGPDADTKPAEAPTGEDGNQIDPDLRGDEQGESVSDGGPVVPDPGQGEANGTGEYPDAEPTTEEDSATEAGETAFDPQPNHPQEVLAAINAWLDGGEKPRWEFAVPEALLPPGYTCKLVRADATFGADYHTFFEMAGFLYDPQPQSAQEVLAAIAAWEQGAEKPRWELEVPADWLPAGYRCEMVDDDEEFGAAYHTLFQDPLYDPQPQTLEEVQAAIDLWEAGGPKPRWQEEVSAEIIPPGYFCAPVSDDPDFGADYHTVFARVAATALSLDSDGFYLVGTPEELDAVRGNLGANYRMYQDIHLDVGGYRSATFTTNNGWVGIGSSSAPFVGEFDGAGHTISGLWCRAGGSGTYSDQGLFGYAKGAFIHDLNLEVETMSATYQVGGVVGYAVDGTRIERCTVTGEMIRVTGGGFAGGIVGLCNVSDPSGFERVVIRDCHVYSRQPGGFAISASGNYLGGVAGSVYKTDIIDCSTSDLAVNGFSYSGGLVGLLDVGSTVSGCVAERPVFNARGSYPGGLIGSINRGSNAVDSHVIQPRITAVLSYAGGFAGVVYGASGIADCTVSEPVLGVGLSYAGGFVGTVYESSAISNCSVDKPHATADVSYVGGFGGEISNATVTGCRVVEPEVEGGSISVGGFAGFIGYGGQVLRCSVDKPLVRANHTAGGFAGDIYDNTNGVVEDCQVRTPTVRTTRSEAGGFVGRLAAPTFAVYNSGRITNCSVKGGTVDTGTYYAGGFVGHSFTAKGTVEDCRVEGVTVTATTYYAGGFGGYMVSASLKVDRCGVTDTDVRGTTDVGGFGGRVYSDPVSTRCIFTDCFVNGGEVTSTGGNRYAGGFVGRHYMQTYINCYSQADVRIVGGTGQGGGFAGHLAGAGTNTRLQNCYATGSVTGSAGGSYGGLIGYRTNTSQIINCYATGTVQAGSGALTGGLIGYSVANISNISNCYFDSTTTRQTRGIGNRSPTAAQVRPLTTRAMIDGASVAFSFGDLDAESADTNNPWYIQEEISYPFLHYQHNGYSQEERDHSLAAVRYQDGTSLGQFRADFHIQGPVPLRVGGAGAQSAYFPYAGSSRHPVNSGSQTDVPSAAFSPDSGLYSLGGVSSTGIIGFAGLPGAVKGSDRPVYQAGDIASYTYLGDAVTYEITVSNYSQDYHWLDVVLRDPLPQGVTLAPGIGTVRVQYDGAGPIVLGQGGVAPFYSYTESTRELSVHLGGLFAAESGDGPQWVTVEFLALVGAEAVSTQPLDPDSDNIRNRGTVSGLLWDWNDHRSAGDYATVFDDQNTDPVFAPLGVRYDGNGNTGGAPPGDNNLYVHGDTVTVLGPGALVKDGFYFYGWSLDPTADPADPAVVIYTPGDRLTIASDSLVFYAVWHHTPPLAEQFEFYKVDGDSLEGLEGARFALYYCENPAHALDGHVHPDQPDSCWVELDNAVTSGPDGLVRLEFQPQEGGFRHYLLTETLAPRGYALPGADWLIYLEDHWQVLTYVQGYAHYQADFLDGRDIDGDGIPDYALPNYRVRYELPDTGGPGIGGYLGTGWVLVVAGSAALLSKCPTARRQAKLDWDANHSAEQEGGP